MIAALGGILAVVVAIAAILAIKRSEWALVLLVSLFSMEQVLQSYFPILIRYSSMFNLMIGSVVLIAVLVRIARQENVGGNAFNGVTWCLIGIYLLQAVGYLWTPSRAYFIEIVNFNWPYLVTMLGLAPLLISSVRAYRRFLIAFLIVGCAVAVMIMVNPRAQFYGGRLRLELGSFAGQMSGNPLAIATMGGMLVIVSSLIRFERGNRVLMLLRAAAFICGMGVAILSGSRGQVIFAVATVVIFYPMSRQVRDLKQFFVVVIGISVLLVGAYVAFKLFLGADNEKRWSTEALTDGASTRFEMILVSLQAYLQSPSRWLFGLGPGTFDSFGLEASYVHNSVVEAWTEMGIAGLILFIMMYWYMFQYGRVLFERFKHDDRYRSAVALLFATMAFQTMLSFKQGSMIAGPSYYLYCLVLARICLADNTYEQEAAESEWDYQGDAQSAWFEGEGDVDEIDGEGFADDFDEQGELGYA